MSVSIPLFGSAWLLPWGKSGDEPVGAIWSVFITHDYICPVSEILTMLATLTFVFAAAAALAGWILQFPICAALDCFHRGKRNDETQ